MNNSSRKSFVVSCKIHRRSRTRKAELEAMRRELARLDNIKDHVLDVVADRILEVLNLPIAEPANSTPAIDHADALTVRISPDCVERTVGQPRVSTAGV